MTEAENLLDGGQVEGGADCWDVRRLGLLYIEVSMASLCG
jgi:hypothetical protein